MTVSGGGVSAGGGNVELADIVAGGAGFAERLKKFAEAAKAAEDTKAQAAAVLRQAQVLKTEAERQFAENQVAAARLHAAQEDVEHERAKLVARHDALLAAARA